MATWSIFENPDQRCRACGLWRADDGQCRDTIRVPGDGAIPNDLVLVGEALGENEERQHRPFVGRAGEILEGCLREVGLLRASVFITNAVRCRPTTPTGRNRKPTTHEVDCCRGYLIDELREVKPRVIVTLGDVATTSLVGRRLGGVLENRGRISWSEELHAFVIPTIHPAYVLRRYSERQWLVEDLRSAKRLIDEGLQQPPEVTVDVVRDLDRLHAVADELCRAERLAFDWETNGVHLTKSEGFCIAFSSRRGHAYVVPRYLSGWQPAWDDGLLSEVDEQLRRILLSDVPKTGHHVAFDNNISKSTLDVWPRNVRFCTLIAHHCLNNHLGERAHGLKVMTALYTPLGRYDDPLDQWLIDNGHTARGLPDKGQLWRAPDDLVHRYNGIDAIATLWMEDVLTPRLHEMGLWDLFVRERMPLVREHQEIDRQGVRIDMQYLDTLSEQLGATLSTLEAEITDLATRPINPASHPQVRALLFNDLELPILDRTENGEASTREDVLLQLRDLHPVVPLILRHRAYAKIKGTYVDGTGKRGQKKALRAVVDEDGYARMDTRLHGTETFRFATRRPFAVHTWPKDQKGMPSVRRLIVPDPGHVFVTADYVQQEFVIQCVVPSTRVLRADLTWACAGDVKIGDRLVGFDENLNQTGRNNLRLKPAVVTHAKRIRRPCYEVVTDRGSVIASAEHLWACRKKASWRRPYEWVSTVDLSVGDQIPFLARPWDVDVSHDAGYLAGFFDGEGSVTSRHVGFSQNPGRTLSRVLRLLRERGIDVARNGLGSPHKFRCYRAVGKENELRLLGMIRPPRLLEKADVIWLNRRAAGAHAKPARVLRVRSVGAREVVALGTSTRTLITEGLLSHNSIAAGQWDMVEALLDYGEDAHERVARDLGGVEKAAYLDPSGVFERDGLRWKSEDAYNEYKKHRSKFKSINFMVLYRGGARRLARIGLGCTRDPRTNTPCKIENDLVCNCEAQAATFIQEYYERYEQIKWWQYRRIMELRETGMVRGLFGSYRRLPGIFDTDKGVQHEAERQACNFPIQNGGAHVMIRALLRTQERIRRERFPGRVVVTIHDQLIVQAPEHLVEDGTYLLRVCMEAPYKELAGRSLRTDVSVVRSWGG